MHTLKRKSHKCDDGSLRALACDMASAYEIGANKMKKTKLVWWV